MTNETFRAAALAASLLVGTAGAAYAQTTTAPGDTVAMETEADDGFDWGWLGLLGLLGLAGLAGRRTATHHVDTVHRTTGTTGTTTGTTGTTGSTRL